MRCTAFSIFTPPTLKSTIVTSPIDISLSVISQYPHTGLASPPVRCTTADKSYPSFTYVIADFNAVISMNDTSQSTHESAPRSFSNYTTGARNLLFSLSMSRFTLKASRSRLPEKLLRNSIFLISLTYDNLANFEFLTLNLNTNFTFSARWNLFHKRYEWKKIECIEHLKPPTDSVRGPWISTFLNGTVNKYKI